LRRGERGVFALGRTDISDIDAGGRIIEETRNHPEIVDRCAVGADRATNRGRHIERGELAVESAEKAMAHVVSIINGSRDCAEVIDARRAGTHASGRIVDGGDFAIGCAQKAMGYPVGIAVGSHHRAQIVDGCGCCALPVGCARLRIVEGDDVPVGIADKTMVQVV